MIFKKKCSKCKVEKEFSGFYRDCSANDGYRSSCKSCCKKWRDSNKESRKIYYEENKDRILTRNRQNYQDNREARLAYRDEYYKKNKVAVIKTNDRWRKNNRDAYNAQRRIWYSNEEHRDYQQSYVKKHYQENKDYYAAKCNKRRAMKHNASPVWADTEAIKKFYADAQALTKSTGLKHEVDHYYPLQGKNVCGLHCEFNLQIITEKENRSKGNKHNE